MSAEQTVDAENAIETAKNYVEAATNAWKVAVKNVSDASNKVSKADDELSKAKERLTAWEIANPNFDRNETAYQNLRSDVKDTELAVKDREAAVKDREAALEKRAAELKDSLIELEKRELALKEIQSALTDEGTGAPNESSDFDKSTRQEAFNEPYQGDAMQNFKEVLYRCHDQWKDTQKRNWFSPYIAIIQSSGYGKSRLCKQFACKDPKYLTIYLCIRDIDQSTGYPEQHKLTVKFLKDLANNTYIDREGPTDKMRSWICCWRILRGIHYVLYSKQNSGTDKVINPADLSEFIKNKKKWKTGKPAPHKSTGDETIEERVAFWNLCQNPVTADDLHTLCIEPLLQLDARNDDRLLSLSSCFDFLLVLDEASLLVRTQVRCGNENITLFRLLRHALVGSGKDRRLFAALVDTTSRVSNFVPVRNSDNSFRLTLNSEDGTDLFAPFTRVTTMDVLCDNVNEGEKENVFTLGRPLWKSTFQHSLPKGEDTEEKLERLMNFAWTKLSCHRALGPKEDTVPIAMLAVLTGLNVSPESSTAESLVASHMATCLGISKDRDSLFVAYPGEPILAYAAMWKLVESVKNGTFHNYVLGPLLSHLRIGSVNAGHNGEFVVKLLLVLTQGTVVEKQKDNRFGPVKLQAFLEALVRKDNKVDENILKILGNTDSLELSFNWFSKVDRHLLNEKPTEEFWKSCSAQETLKSFYNRCAALEFPDNHEGADLLLPVKMVKVCSDDGTKGDILDAKDNAQHDEEERANDVDPDSIDAKKVSYDVEYKYILIQVKNIVHYSVSQEVIDKLQPEYVFGPESGWIDFDVGFGILINVGDVETTTPIKIRKPYVKMTGGASSIAPEGKIRNCLVLNGLGVFKNLFCRTNDAPTSSGAYTKWDDVVASFNEILHGRSVLDVEDLADVKKYYPLWNFCEDNSVRDMHQNKKHKTMSKGN